MTVAAASHQEFLAAKSQFGDASGFDPVWLPEKGPAYCELIRARLRKPIQPDLFGAAG